MVPKNTSEIVSYYDVLHVSPLASQEDIKRAYRKLALQYHPDHNPGQEQQFHLIKEAYAHLETREKRGRYNRLMRSRGMPVTGRQKPDNDNSSWLSQLAGAFLRPTTKSGSPR